jgi:Fic family protein
MAKMPKSPPSIAPIIRGLLKDSSRLVELFRVAPGPLSDGRYLHWDELVYRQPPGSLTHEEWWTALKMQRRLLHKTVPLKGKDGISFNYLTVDPIPEELHHIDQDAGGQIEMPDRITNPRTRDRYYINSLVEEAIASSQLEGAATTRQVAKEMIRTGQRPAGRGQQMIFNNFQTMKRIGELKDEPLTPELVLEIHRRITDRTLKNPSAAGRVRTADEPVFVVDDRDRTVHTPPPAAELDARMAAMCEFANASEPFIHPVVRSIILHFWLGYDHPFVDGNGRTARSLFYWSMLRHRFWLFEFISISSVILKAPTQYGKAFLYTETDENDLTYFILYHLKVIRRAIEQLHEYIQRKTEQLRVVEATAHAVPMLNHRQRALLSHALRHTGHRYTVESHRMSHGVVHQTARRDLFGLAEKELLDAVKLGKKWYFTPVADLEGALKKL